jgi:hypothetical protein
MEEMRNAYKNLLGNPFGNVHFKCGEGNVRKTLRTVFQREAARVGGRWN